MQGHTHGTHGSEGVLGTSLATRAWARRQKRVRCNQKRKPKCLARGLHVVIRVTFLFGTGANKTDAPFRVLGFPENTDTTNDAITLGVQGSYAVDPTPIRYVDLQLAQMPEFRPFARVFLNAGDFARPFDRPTEFRLLTDPIGHLTRLDLTLRFNEDQPYSASADLFHDIALDVISLEPVSKKPNWVNQRFLI